MPWDYFLVAMFWLGNRISLAAWYLKETVLSIVGCTQVPTVVDDQTWTRETCINELFIGYKTPEENYYTRIIIGWELEIKTYVTCILSNVLRQVFCSRVFTCDVSILKVRRLSIYRQKPGWYLMKIFPGDISIKPFEHI